MAARVGAVECVNALIQFGSDVSAKDVRRESLSMFFIKEEMEDLMTDICLGVDVTVYGVWGRIYTPFLLILNVVELLLCVGVCVRERFLSV